MYSIKDRMRGFFNIRSLLRIIRNTYYPITCYFLSIIIKFISQESNELKTLARKSHWYRHKLTDPIICRQKLVYLCKMHTGLKLYSFNATTLKHQKTRSFLMLSGSLERKPLVWNNSVITAYNSVNLHIFYNILPGENLFHLWISTFLTAWH